MSKSRHTHTHTHISSSAVHLATPSAVDALTKPLLPFSLVGLTSFYPPVKALWAYTNTSWHAVSVVRVSEKVFMSREDTERFYARHARCLHASLSLSAERVWEGFAANCHWVDRDGLLIWESQRAGSAQEHHDRVQPGECGGLLRDWRRAREVGDGFHQILGVRWNLFRPISCFGLISYIHRGDFRLSGTFFYQSSEWHKVYQFTWIHLIYSPYTPILLCLTY